MHLCITEYDRLFQNHSLMDLNNLKQLKSCIFQKKYLVYTLSEFLHCNLQDKNPGIPKWWLSTFFHIKPCQFLISIGPKGSKRQLPFRCVVTFVLALSHSRYQARYPRAPARGTAVALRQAAQRSTIGSGGRAGVRPVEFPVQPAARTCHSLTSHSGF